MEEKKIKKVIVVFEDEEPFLYEAKDEDDRKSAMLIYSALQDAVRDGGLSAFFLAYKTRRSMGSNGAYGNANDCFQLMSCTLSDICFKASTLSAHTSGKVKRGQKSYVDFPSQELPICKFNIGDHNPAGQLFTCRKLCRT